MRSLVFMVVLLALTQVEVQGRGLPDLIRGKREANTTAIVEPPANATTTEAKANILPEPIKKWPGCYPDCDWSSCQICNNYPCSCESSDCGFPSYCVPQQCPCPVPCEPCNPTPCECGGWKTPDWDDGWQPCDCSGDWQDCPVDPIKKIK